MCEGHVIILCAWVSLSVSVLRFHTHFDNEGQLVPQKRWTGDNVLMVANGIFTVTTTAVSTQQHYISTAIFNQTDEETEPYPAVFFFAFSLRVTSGFLFESSLPITGVGSNNNNGLFVHLSPTVLEDGDFSLLLSDSPLEAPSEQRTEENLYFDAIYHVVVRFERSQKNDATATATVANTVRQIDPYTDLFLPTNPFSTRAAPFPTKLYIYSHTDTAVGTIYLSQFIVCTEFDDIRALHGKSKYHIEQENVCNGVTCPPNSSCNNNDLSGTCVCDSGFQTQGDQCVPTDEEPVFLTCESVEAQQTCSADPNLFCRDNDDTGYSCLCDPGYTAASTNQDQVTTTCVDIDECTQTAATCPSSTTCFNFEGGYSCVCDSSSTAVFGGASSANSIQRCEQVPSGTASTFSCSSAEVQSGESITCKLKVRDVNGDLTTIEGSQLRLSGIPQTEISNNNVVVDMPPENLRSSSLSIAITTNINIAFSLQMSLAVGNTEVVVSGGAQVTDIRFVSYVGCGTLVTDPDEQRCSSSTQLQDNTCECQNADARCIQGICEVVLGAGDSECPDDITDATGGSYTLNTCTALSSLSSQANDIAVQCNDLCEATLDSLVSDDSSQSTRQTIVISNIQAQIQSMEATGQTEKVTTIRLENSSVRVNVMLITDGNTLVLRITVEDSASLKKMVRSQHRALTKEDRFQTLQNIASGNVLVEGDIIVGAEGEVVYDIPTQIYSPNIRLGVGAVLRLEQGTIVSSGSIILSDRSSFTVRDADLLFADSCAGTGVISSTNCVFKTEDSSSAHRCSHFLGVSTDTISTSALDGCGSTGPVTAMNSRIVLRQSCVNARTIFSNENTNIPLVTTGEVELRVADFIDNGQRIKLQGSGGWINEGLLTVRFESFGSKVPVPNQETVILEYAAFTSESAQSEVRAAVRFPVAEAPHLTGTLQPRQDALVVVWSERQQTTPSPPPSTPPTTPTAPATGSSTNTNSGGGSTPINTNNGGVIPRSQNGGTVIGGGGGNDGGDGGSGASGMIGGVVGGVGVVLLCICFISGFFLWKTRSSDDDMYKLQAIKTTATQLQSPFGNQHQGYPPHYNYNAAAGLPSPTNPMNFW